jgi:thiol-disulfide isomerase/thioredoxin
MREFVVVSRKETPVKFALTAVALAGLALAGVAADEKVTVAVVKYDGLTDVIKKNKSKVVVLDFWADYCVPCKREFPTLVALSRKHAKDAFAAVSVSLDDVSEEGAKDRVLRFLDRQKATFTNLILDEKPECWQAKLKIDGPPLVMVFDKAGGLEQKFIGEAVNYETVGKLVAELLKK